MNAVEIYGKGGVLMEQTSLYPRNPDRCCDTCSYYSALKEPRACSNNAVIYGYCFKNIYNMGKEYPVFIDGGACETYKRVRRPEATP